MAPYIDLHVHTRYSDGSMTPLEVVRLLAAKEISTLAITDHDTLEGLPEAAKACTELGVIWIPGIEVSVDSPQEFQILGYGFDSTHQGLRDLVQKINVHRVRECIKVLSKMQKMGMELLPDAEIFRQGIQFDQLIQLFVHHGFGRTQQEVIEKYFAEGQPLYMKTYKPGIEECIQTIKAAGGFTVLAHPVRITRCSTELENLIQQLLIYGLDGIECYHPEHPTEYANHCVALANKHGLKITGGSDLHVEYNGYQILTSLLDF